jgi:hypothetical protein
MKKFDQAVIYDWFLIDLGAPVHKTGSMHKKKHPTSYQLSGTFHPLNLHPSHRNNLWFDYFVQKKIISSLFNCSRELLCCSAGSSVHRYCEMEKPAFFNLSV